MALRVAINGFGRIGRLCLRALLEQKAQDIEVVAINDLGPLETNTHLFKYDSVHGISADDVSCDDAHLIINEKPIAYFMERAPENLPWGDHDIDIVFECSGQFKSHESASQHLKAGAKKVLISAPAHDADLSVVYGVNHHLLKAEHKIVSNASCTTNCLAPVIHVLDQLVGIEKGYMTTVHAMTGDQHTVDKVHKDLHRARAAAHSMIPTTTGAAKAVGLVMPHLAGKLDGCAIRVPTQNVSLIDLKVQVTRPTTVEEINQAFIEAANGPLNGILGTYNVPLVSIDYNHNPNSSSFDLTETTVVDGDFVRVLAWYDNEWGFSNRMIDTARCMQSVGF
jgi:glyceraldehyde 3-phosphate dehydrogenase